VKHIVVISGAGVSQESGISTFRDSNGLWENHRIEDIASPEGFTRNPELVFNFYNLRRRQLFEVEPNAAHKLIVDLEEKNKVTVITQNVDDLHERAGSTNVLHLHGELRKVRSVEGPNLTYKWEKDLNSGDLCEKGFQLRPHIVWFGEAVPEIENALNIVQSADVVIVIGTSLQVYPAAGLIYEVPTATKIYYIDPNPTIVSERNIEVIDKIASEGMKIVQKKLNIV